MLGAHDRTLRRAAASRGTVVHRLGAAAPRRARRRRLQRLGRRRPRDAPHGRHRRLGAVRARPRRRARSTSSSSSPARGGWVDEGRPDGAATPRCRRRPRRSSARAPLRLGRRRLDGARASAQPARRGPMSVYELHLGSWRPGLGYRDVADAAHRVRRPSWASRTSSSCRSPSIRSAARWGYQVTGYFAPTSRFGHPDDLRYLIDRLHQAGIGVIMDWVPGALPEGRVGARPLRRRSRSTSTPTRAAASRWTGARYVFDFGRTRGAQLPRGERAVLARGVPRRRAARRRRRLDALPRLLARGRRVGAEHLRRPREPRGDRRSCRRSTRPPTSATPAS